MANAIEEIEAVEALKRLIRLAVGEGYSYAQIADSEEVSPHWNANSIKQFANRKAVSRKSPKLIPLSDIIVMYFKSLNITNDVIIRDISKVSDILLNLSDTSIYEDIESAYSSVYERANSINFSRYSHFCRYSIDHSYIVSMRIITSRMPEGTSFVMKISGRYGNKRVVIGNVSNTIINTYLSGIAYNVLSKFSEKEFSSLDFFEEHNRMKHLAENPIGQEIISFSNRLIDKNEIEAPYCGLDGRGNPISGIGILLSDTVSIEYGLKAGHPSSIRCSDDEDSLVRLMRSHKAVTNSYPSLSDL